VIQNEKRYTYPYQRKNTYPPTSTQCVEGIIKYTKLQFFLPGVPDWFTSHTSSHRNVKSYGGQAAEDRQRGWRMTGLDVLGCFYVPKRVEATRAGESLNSPALVLMIKRYGRRIFSVAVLLVPAGVAVMVAEFCPPPRLSVRVVIVKVAVVAPAGMVTVAGTEAFFVSLLRRVTERPPSPAGPLSVTVPVEMAGAVTVVGFNTSETSAGPLPASGAERQRVARSSLCRRCC
jgi:hypothetical protein